MYPKESPMNRQVRSTWSSVPAKVVLAALLVALPVARGSAGNLYVDQNATGANNGSSWANAYSSLQTALTAAVSGDTLRVAQGVYYPTAGYSRAPTFQLKNGVTLYGGYPTGGGTRNPAAYVATLSGDIGTVGSKGDNSYHVVTGSGTDNTAVIDGFVITGGNASGPDPDDRGGGMYNKSGSPTVRNVTFSGNTATNGGGVHNYESSPTLTDVTFTGNSATNRGGGLYGGGGWGSSSPTLTNVTFTGNTATNGGGLCNDDYSGGTLTNVTFSGNSASDRGGGSTTTGAPRPSPTSPSAATRRTTPAAGYTTTGAARGSPTSPSAATRPPAARELSPALVQVRRRCATQSYGTGCRAKSLAVRL
jgi:predicted outer membrane repeat protein